MWTIALQHLVVTEAPASTWFTTTNASAIFPTLAGIATRNWILALPTSVATEPNALRRAITWISPALANWATLAVCAMKTLTSAPFRHRVVTEPPVRTRTDLTVASAPRATKAATV